ncbi:HK97 family phage prohead protease [Nonomuraea sp. NPDC050786]|uniref:HK97 family phage prohead protease n=1 Tax=Nonomuraea sp. NPDC050786 TaxID=3154840 RepID=UPI0033E1DF91
MSQFFTRSFPLEDIAVLSDGDGRTVEAYAAVFRSPAEVRDQDGHYMEQIDPGAFTRTIQHRGTKLGVFYNHGLTLHGSPSDRGAVPIGTPLEVKVDNVGLRTITRYNRTALAEEVLEAIKTGSIRAQSFTGRFLRSNPARVPKKARGGELPTVTRMEIDLREYGPTPFPVYQDALITGVRSVMGRDPLLARLLDEGLDEEEILARLRAVILDGSSSGTVRSEGSDVGTPAVDSPPSVDTPPDADPSAGDPAPGHSARLTRAQVNALRIKLREKAHGHDQEAKRSA